MKEGDGLQKHVKKETPLTRYITIISLAIIVGFSSAVYSETFIGLIPLLIATFILFNSLLELIAKYKKASKESEKTEEEKLRWKGEKSGFWFYFVGMSILVVVLCCYLWIERQSPEDNFSSENISSDFPENIPVEASETIIETESQEVFTDTLIAGHYTVGVDIPSGTYNFYAKSGYGNILSDSGSVNEIFDSGTMMSDVAQGFTTSEISNIELFDGDVLTVSGTLEVSAGCDNAGEVAPREQELEEIELGYGIYSAGDDFAPGTYDIEWIEGNGNIQTDPYELHYGINEIFGAKLGEDGSVIDELNKDLYGDYTDNYPEYIEDYDNVNDLMYIKRFENATFSESDLLKIEDIKVKLIPSS